MSPYFYHEVTMSSNVTKYTNKAEILPTVNPVSKLVLSKHLTFNNGWKYTALCNMKSSNESIIDINIYLTKLLCTNLVKKTFVRPFLSELRYVGAGVKLVVRSIMLW